MLRRASCALGLVTALAGCGAPTPEAATRNVPLGPAPKEPCGPVQGPDTDGDALSDAEEARRGTDPKLADSDGDGKNDAQEACHYGTDPLRRDTDGDGVADGAEIAKGTDPTLASGQPAPNETPAGTSGTSKTGPGGAGGSPNLLPVADPRAGFDSAAWSCAMMGPRGGNKSVCFLPVPGGTFQMGAQATSASEPNHEPSALAHEGPVHEVTVAPFWMMQHEVTADLYAACVRAQACPADGALDATTGTVGAPGKGHMPAIGLTAAGADAVCAFLGARLPTEAEWEYVARGPNHRIWPDTEGPHPSCGYPTLQADGHPQRVAEPPDGCGDEPLRTWSDHSDPGPFGHFHLTGNVSEWTSDVWSADAYARHGATDPKATEGDASRRAVRGGSHMLRSAQERRAAVRAGVPVEAKLPDLGARCAVTAAVP